MIRKITKEERRAHIVATLEKVINNYRLRNRAINPYISKKIEMFTQHKNDKYKVIPHDQQKKWPQGNSFFNW